MKYFTKKGGKIQKRIKASIVLKLILISYKLWFVSNKYNP